MLAGKRAGRVGEQLLREIADILLKKVKDPRVKGVTLTGIHLSDDLRYARVFYSVMGEKTSAHRTQTGLDSAKGFIKREIGIRLDLRYMPDIIFKHDPSLQEGNALERLFKNLKLDDSSDK